jgi:hypothetical protein
MMGPHTRLLSLSSDGKIPEAAWREARRLDAIAAIAAAEAPAPAPALPSVVAFNPNDVIARMVRVIAEALPKRGLVHELDFAQAGVPADLARRYGPQAYALARAHDHAIDRLAAGI